VLKNSQSDEHSSSVSWSKEDSTVTAIAVFAFKRLDLLRKTLRSLEEAEGFPGGPLFVFSDAARSDVEGENQQVAELRKWLRNWCQVHNACLIEADANKGLRRSIVEGVSLLLRQYERIIVLEDDIIVSRCFLKFMWQALTTFGDNSDIYQVSGYFVPHRRRCPDIGLLGVPGCWGWGTWRRAWEHYNDNAVELLSRIPESEAHQFNIEGTYAYYEALRRNAEGVQNTWAVRWYASVFLRAGLVVYPGSSLTRNIGFEAGATNCDAGAMAPVFNKQQIHHSMSILEQAQASIGIVEDKRLREVLADFYRWQQQQWSKPSRWEVWAGRWRRLTQMVRGQ
jgi:hypothetical protein